MDQVTVDAVKEVVDGLTSQGELFSSYDVTRKLRDEKSLTVYHSEVRKAVHAMFANLEMPVDYERDDFSLPSGHTTLVFHPRTKSTTDYDPTQFGGDVADPFRTTTPLTVQTQTQPSTPQVTPVSSQTDKRGRFCIPNKLTRKAAVGMIAGTNVWVNADPNSRQIIVSHAPKQITGSLMQSYKVDKDDNLRLSQKMLKKAGLSGKHLTVKVDGSTIVVE